MGYDKAAFLNALRTRTSAMEFIRDYADLCAEGAAVRLNGIAQSPEELRVYRDMFREFAQSIGSANVDLIYRNAQSPIEVYLLFSLVTLFMKNNPAGLVVTGPVSDVTSDLSGFRAGLFRGINTYRKLRSINPHMTDSDFLDHVQRVEENHPQFSGATADFSVTLLYDLILKSAFHVTCQPGVRDVLVNGRTLRPDILVWLPVDPKFLVVIECDGYAFHGSRNSFEADRQRDRAMTRAGYRVLRFSGAELWNDPVKCGTELGTYLFDRLDQQAREH